MSQPPIKSVKRDTEVSDFVSETAHKKSWSRNRYTGILLAICSAVLFTCTGIIAKHLKETHVLNLSLFRFGGMFLFALPLVLRGYMVQGASLFGQIWPPTDKPSLIMLLLLFGRSTMGFSAIICYFHAVKYIPVGDVSVIGSMQMVTVALCAHVTLGEKCGVVPALAAVVTLAGIAFIAKPPILTGQDEYDVNTLIETSYAVGRVLFASVAVIFLRRLRTLNGTIVVLLAGLVQLVENGAAVLILGVFELPGDSWSWALCLGTGVLSFVSQMTLTLSLKCEEAGPFAIVWIASI
ncbi:uncharacterized protein LOC110858954 [Folsomia candida]|nr:uncharacterized protein LOC110858954 [Folsomia candida]